MDEPSAAGVGRRRDAKNGDSGSDPPSGIEVRKDAIPEPARPPRHAPAVVPGWPDRSSRVDARRRRGQTCAASCFSLRNRSSGIDPW